MADMTITIRRNDDDDRRMATIRYAPSTWWNEDKVDFLIEATELFKRISDATIGEIINLSTMLMSTFEFTCVPAESIYRNGDLIGTIGSNYDDDRNITEIYCIFYEEGYEVNGEKPE